MSYEDIIRQKRPKSRHPKMKRSRRAKIFQPFAALTGYEEATAAKERQYKSKIELTSEREESLNEILLHLRIHDHVTCVYFEYRQQELGEYITVKGKVNAINSVYHYLQIDQKKIFFDVLYDLQIDEK